jgi:hypothetical protein
VSERLRSIVEQLDIRPDDRVLEATLEELDLRDRRFDKIFAVRVGLFHRDPDRAHALVEPWLAAGGVVSSFFDPPSGRAEAGE